LSYGGDEEGSEEGAGGRGVFEGEWTGMIVRF
jgi:hypothetical protein